MVRFWRTASWRTAQRKENGSFLNRRTPRKRRTTPQEPLFFCCFEEFKERLSFLVLLFSLSGSWNKQRTAPFIFWAVLQLAILQLAVLQLAVLQLAVLQLAVLQKRTMLLVSRKEFKENKVKEQSFWTRCSSSLFKKTRFCLFVSRMVCFKNKKKHKGVCVFQKNRCSSVQEDQVLFNKKPGFVSEEQVLFSSTRRRTRCCSRRQRC